MYYLRINSKSFKYLKTNTLINQMSTAKRIVLSYATRKLLNITVADSSVINAGNRNFINFSKNYNKPYMQWKPVNYHKLDNSKIKTKIQN